ncbi:MAG: hypothetical protein U0270_38895 [Labilithrix sp.]
MKHYATFFLIASMSLGLVFLLFTRARESHNAPAEVIEVKAPVADAGPEAGPTVASSASAAPAAVDAAAVDAGPAAASLRVATLGWELAAPAATLGATSSVEVAPEASLDELEKRLARGGSDPQGADVAILPLPSFVMSYEHLSALKLQAFLVVGFSHGREEVHANAGALLRAPPGADEVKVVSGGSESANVLALFSVDLLGVAPSRIRMVTAEADVKAAAFSAVVKGTSDTRKLAFSTADASRLVPIVAVAPKAVLDAREKELQDWSKSWLEGLGAVANDVPGVSRKLAGKTDVRLASGVGGAPEALVLVERLGLIERVALDRETSIMGPLAKSPVTLETLMTRTWQLSRGAGLATAAAPDPLPVDTRILTAIAPAPKDAPAPTAPEGDAGAEKFGPLPTGTVPLVMYRATDGDADKVATQIHFLSGVFERAYFKVQAKGGEKAAKAIAAAARDKGVASSRLATTAGDPPGAVAAVELLAPP